MGHLKKDPEKLLGDRKLMDSYVILVAFAVVIIIIVVGYVLFRRGSSKPVGSPCSVNGDCNSGLVCDQTSGVCRTPIGTVCVVSSDCTNNASCVSGVCTIVPAPSTTSTTPSMLPMNVPVAVVDEGSCTETSHSDSSRTSSYSHSREYRRQPRFSYNSARTSVDFRTSGNDSWNTLDDTRSYTKRSIIEPLITSRRVKTDRRINKTSVENPRDVCGGYIVHKGCIEYCGKKYKSSLIPDRIEVFKNTVFALYNGRLHHLASEEGSTMNWEKTTGLPEGVIHTSVTRNDSHIWIQTSQVGYLFDSDFNQIEKADVQGYIRNYGLNMDRYIDSFYNKNQCRIYTDMKELVQPCAYAIFDHGGSALLILTQEEWKSYKDIRLTENSYIVLSR